MINTLIKKILPIKLKKKIKTVIQAPYYTSIKNKLFTKQDDYKKLEEKAAKITDIKLHFGCGPRVLKNWINIDLTFEPYEKYLIYYGDEHYPKEIRGTKNDFYSINIIKRGLPLPDDSVDIIFHEDFIEHINQRDQIVFLSETFRVLKEGGLHRINTPDLIKSMEKSTFQKGKDGVYVEEWDNHIHFNLLTKNYIQDIAKMIGYTEVIFNSKNKSVSREIPREYRPDPKDREEDGNLFIDLIK
jgi:predicted SAM-dependent methyltransferase